MEIKTENLSKTYLLDGKTEVKALKDISLEINAGEIIAVSGPSGAGKSTLLHLLGLMDRPTSGSLFLDGTDAFTFSDRERSVLRGKKIGFLFQMHYLLPEFSVLENILIPAWKNRKNKKAEALTLLEQLGLGDRMKHLPSELSGGEQQRAALARALINGPEVLLADEPTGDLDRETGEKVEEMIFSKCRENNVTLILVTHNEELSRKAGRIVRLRDGLLQGSAKAPGVPADAAFFEHKQSMQQKHFL